MKVLWGLALICGLTGGLMMISAGQEIDSVTIWDLGAIGRGLQTVSENQQVIFRAVEGLAIAMIPLALVLCISKLAEPGKPKERKAEKPANLPPENQI